MRIQTNQCARWVSKLSLSSPLCATYILLFSLRTASCKTRKESSQLVIQTAPGETAAVKGHVFQTSTCATSHSF